MEYVRKVVRSLTHTQTHRCKAWMMLSTCIGVSALDRGVEHAVSHHALLLWSLPLFLPLILFVHSSGASDR